MFIVVSLLQLRLLVGLGVIVGVGVDCVDAGVPVGVGDKNGVKVGVGVGNGVATSQSTTSWFTQMVNVSPVKFP
jgi:hypothetical protein